VNVPNEQGSHTDKLDCLKNDADIEQRLEPFFGVVVDYDPEDTYC
jgi:heat shock protein HspQ